MSTEVKSAPAAIVKSADMPEEMQKVAIQVAQDALLANDIEKDIAAAIKREFDKRFGPTWHVVVGKAFGSYVTHESGHFLYAYIGNIAILLFKAG